MSDGSIKVPTVTVDGKETDCEVIVRGGISYYQQRVVEMSAAAILAQLTGGSTGVIDHSHRMIHLGKLFSGSAHDAALADTAYLDLLVQMGPLSAHAVFSCTVAGDALMSVYEGATFSAAGAAVSTPNHNRSSALVTDMTVTHTPTVTGTGTQLNGSKFIPGGQKASSVGAEAGFGSEYILAPSTIYLCRVQNVAGAAKRVCVGIEFYQSGL